MEFDRVWQSLVGFGVQLVGCSPEAGGSLAAFVAIAAVVVAVAVCCSAAG